MYISILHDGAAKWPRDMQLSQKRLRGVHDDLQDDKKLLYSAVIHLGRRTGDVIVRSSTNSAHSFMQNDTVSPESPIQTHHEQPLKEARLPERLKASLIRHEVFLPDDSLDPNMKQFLENACATTTTGYPVLKDPVALQLQAMTDCADRTIGYKDQHGETYVNLASAQQQALRLAAKHRDASFLKIGSRHFEDAMFPSSDPAVVQQRIAQAPENPFAELLLARYPVNSSVPKLANKASSKEATDKNNIHDVSSGLQLASLIDKFIVGFNPSNIIVTMPLKQDAHAEEPSGRERLMKYAPKPPDTLKRKALSAAEPDREAKRLALLPKRFVDNDDLLTAGPVAYDPLQASSSELFLSGPILPEDFHGSLSDYLNLEE